MVSQPPTLTRAIVSDLNNIGSHAAHYEGNGLGRDASIPAMVHLAEAVLRAHQLLRREPRY